MIIGYRICLNGEISLDGQDIIQKVVNLLAKEFKESKILLLKVIGISLLCSLLKYLQNHFEGNVSEIAFYTCYLLIIILIITSFTNIISVCTKAISRLKQFMYLLIPILITLLLTMGNIATVTAIQPILLMMISVMTALISNFIIPVILISTILNLVGNISQEMNVNAISKFFRKSMLYAIELMMIIFVRNSFH